MLNKLKNILLSKEFQRFFIVGVLAFLIDFALLNFQVYILNFRLILLGIIFIPNIISTSSAIVFGFFAQRIWAFQSNRQTKIFNQLIKFLTVQGFNLIVFNTLLFGVLIQLEIPIPLTKISVTIIQMGFSYILFKYFVFQKTARPIRSSANRI